MGGLDIPVHTNLQQDQVRVQDIPRPGTLVLPSGIHDCGTPICKRYNIIIIVLSFYWCSYIIGNERCSGMDGQEHTFNWLNTRRLEGIIIISDSGINFHLSKFTIAILTYRLTP